MFQRDLSKCRNLNFRNLSKHINIPGGPTSNKSSERYTNMLRLQKVYYFDLIW